MSRSRIPPFTQLSVSERIALLQQRGVLTTDAAAALDGGTSALDVAAADRSIKTVIGVFSLPMGLGLIDPARARAELLARGAELVALANSGYPTMVARGGARGSEVFLRGATTQNGELLVVHLLVDTRGATRDRRRARRRGARGHRARSRAQL